MLVLEGEEAGADEFKGWTKDLWGALPVALGRLAAKNEGVELQGLGEEAVEGGCLATALGNVLEDTAEEQGG